MRRMNVIFQGRRCRVVSCTAEGVLLKPRVDDGTRIQVRTSHPDLVLAPTAVDMVLAAAFERGDVGAFEYADGRTYPPNREISRPIAQQQRPPVVH